MNQLSITAVAKRFGLRPSALRYYERIGILPRATLVGGKRHYDANTLARIALVQRARQVGFSLAEIRELFCGFEPKTTASERWRRLAAGKMEELVAASDRIRTMQGLLDKMSRCSCAGLDECGTAMLRKMCGETVVSAATDHRAKKRVTE
jgi:MerR family transcriptional regulator, redox-sensitive transcriptional activator SoxR